MRIISADQVRTNLLRLLDEVAENEEPVLIQGIRADAVLVSEDVWRGVEETLHLVSIPGMRESILEGRETPITECCDEPW